jgi:hypothetical protein
MAICQQRNDQREIWAMKPEGVKAEGITFSRHRQGRQVVSNMQWGAAQLTLTPSRDIIICIVVMNTGSFKTKNRGWKRASGTNGRTGDGWMDGLQSGALEGLRVWTDGASVRVGTDGPRVRLMGGTDGPRVRLVGGWACGRMGCPIKRTIDGGQQGNRGTDGWVERCKGRLG